MKHEKEMQQARRLQEERNALREAGIKRIEELLKQHGRTMLTEPMQVNEVCREYKVAGFEWSVLDPWLTNEQSKPLATANIIYETHGAGGIVPLPRRYTIRSEANTPQKAWRLVEILEDALGI